MTFKIRGGREIDSLGKKAGKGVLCQVDLAGTIGVAQDQYLYDDRETTETGNENTDTNSVH